MFMICFVLYLEHATFTKVAFVYAENMTFGLTTSEKLANQIEG
jgi:hypothetical protein